MLRRPPCSVSPRRIGPALCASLAVTVFVAIGCTTRVEKSLGGPDQASSGATEPHTALRPVHCPERAPAPAALPNSFPELSQLSYWLAQHDEAKLSASLLSPTELRSHAVAMRTSPDGIAPSLNLARTLSSEEITAQLSARFAAFEPRFSSGEWVAVTDPAQSLAALRGNPGSAFVDARSLHVALAPVDLYCMPFTSRVRSTTGTPQFDRNRCSQARAQEPIEVLGRYGPTLRVARTRYAWGFIREQAALSPKVPSELEPLYRTPTEELTLTGELTQGKASLPQGTLLPLVGTSQNTSATAAYEAILATTHGFEHTTLTVSQAMPTARPLTRRAFWTEAFKYIKGPYGWGDENGGRDCSRLWVDVLNQFGLHPPRTSGDQSSSGLFSVDVPADASETERLSLLDEAHARGIVLAHFPGHIMAYLGRDHQGTPRAFHSFAEYMVPCDGGGERLLDVGSVQVTDLTLGEGTSRRSFLQRITRLTVFGKGPDHALLALSTFRRAVPPALTAPETCRDSAEFALFRSPREPHEKAPLRVIAVTQDDARPASLFLIDPGGELVAPEVRDLGVGPFARITEIAQPRRGRYTALLADGDRILACNRIHVAERPNTSRSTAVREPEAPAWVSKTNWGRATENLYAAFVEHLFSQPTGDLGSWPSLTPLIADRNYNLLFDHLGLGEDSQLKLNPDCADLPYFLRAYFAWKMGLPFGYRACTRGRANVAPRCGDLLTHNTPVTAENDLSAFDTFIRTKVGSSVHSASARTLPDDENSDLYPLPLTREALKPGTVFADPYGHTLVVAKWIPQGIRGAGMLIAADAQPDATVSRKRFWRGNFLFTPETHEVGAGFKAFRPLVERRQDRWVEALSTEALASAAAFIPASRSQHEGTLDDFYARMDELIYPRPIGLEDRLDQLVSALYEQVERRIEAIDVGERGISRGARPISMPEGYAVFETTGAWEDFATPSRDMRLLIAIDAVRKLPREVGQRPERFGLKQEDAAAKEQATAELLQAALAARRFRYTRSDGSAFELSLSDVVSRSEALETAYNPNDCPEARWGAEKGSEEYAPCARTAPKAQRALMERYRPWFQGRSRPPR